MFEGITLLIRLKKETKQIIGMLNLNEIHKKILTLMGKNYEKMYLC